VNYPPMNPAATSWNCVDADYGYFASYYVTYAFYDHMTEQNPLLGLYRKFFDFVGIHVIGIGQLNVTPLVDALTTPWPQFPAFNLQQNDPGFDYQLPWNVRGDRMFLKIQPSPFSGQVGAAFALTHLIVSGRQDMSFPVRGSIL
jgi:hypothetical protein